MSNSDKLAQQDENGDIRFNYDPTATEGFTLLNTGYYRGIIEDCPVKKKQGDPTAVPFLAVRFRADPQPGRDKGRVVFENVSFKAQWKLTQLKAAVFGKQEAGESVINPAEIQGQSVTVYITQQPDTRSGHAGEMQNNIARFVPLEEADTVELYDWSIEQAAADESTAPAEDAATGGWGDLPGGEAASEPAPIESEEELAERVTAEETVPFEDVAPAAPVARPASRPATKAAAKKVPARRR